MKEREREYAIEIALSRIRRIFSFGKFWAAPYKKKGVWTRIPPLIFFCGPKAVKEKKPKKR